MIQIHAWFQQNLYSDCCITARIHICSVEAQGTKYTAVAA